MEKLWANIHPTSAMRFFFLDPLPGYEKVGDRSDFAQLIRDRFLSILGDMPTNQIPVCHETGRSKTKAYVRYSLLVET